MKNLNDLFFARDEFYRSFEDFYKKRRSQHSSTFDDSFRLQDFVQNQHRLLSHIRQSLAGDNYELSPAKEQIIFNDKHRTIYRFSLLDEFVLFHFARCLSVKADSIYSDSLYSYRTGFSPQRTLNALASYLRQTPNPYLLRRDIKSFGESMRHSEITRIFEEHFTKDTRLTGLLDQVCRFKIQTETNIETNDRGLPTGHSIQLVFNNLYLTALDKKLAAIPASFYSRFGDDILFASQTKEVAEEIQALLDQSIQDLGLEFNQTKSAYLQLVKPHEVSAFIGNGPKSLASFEYLGAQIDFSGRIRLPRKKTRYIRNLIRSRLKLASRLIDRPEPIERARLYAKLICQLLDSKELFHSNPLLQYLTLAQDDNQLRQMDRWVALSVIRFATNSKLSKGQFKKISYKQLRDLGLPSFLHWKRTHVIHS